MVASIPYDRWQEAQIAERKLHTMEKNKAIEHYRRAYSFNFNYCGIDANDLHGKDIIEIGCADVPALYFCNNFVGGIVEPMRSNILSELCEEKGMSLIKCALEEMYPIPQDEAWIFNVMQHVIDPELFILKLKQFGKTIRFFEPIKTGITSYHPHSFDVDDFTRWFGDAVQLYDRDDIPGFHNGPCCYGIYSTKK